MSTVRVDASGPLKGTIVPPPDKSISHRMALLGAMADTPVRISNYLEAEDTLSTLRAVQALGALVERRPDEVVLRGAGLRQAREPDDHIDVGNAGTLMRLLPGWLAAQPGRTFTLDGDASIRKRPVDRISVPLREMGAQIEAAEGRFPPFTITGQRLHGIRYELPVASAQVKSCVLFAGLLAEGPTTVVEPQLSRDHTERLLAAAGAPLRREGDAITVSSVDELTLDDVLTVPGDPSSAAFAIAAGHPRQGLAPGDPGLRRQPHPHRLHHDRPADGRDRARGPRARAAATARSRPPSRSAISTSPPAGSSARSCSRTRCRWRSTSCRSSGCSAASPRARPSSPGRGSCA